MGMFDTLLCKYPLPLNELLQELKIEWSATGFQTKDLDCSMAMYEITEDGKLYEEVVEREYVCYTEEELAAITPKPWNPYKEVLVKNRYMKPISHHGVINFYDSLNYTATQNVWVEFSAYFIYGKLDKIALYNVELNDSYEVSNRIFQEKLEAKEKLLWERIKRALTHVGWRWFWRKAATACYVTQNWMGKVQTAIYKHLL